MCNIRDKMLFFNKIKKTSGELPAPKTRIGCQTTERTDEARDDKNPFHTTTKQPVWFHSGRRTHQCILVGGK